MMPRLLSSTDPDLATPYQVCIPAPWLRAEIYRAGQARCANAPRAGSGARQCLLQAWVGVSPCQNAGPVAWLFGTCRGIINNGLSILWTRACAQHLPTVPPVPRRMRAHRRRLAAIGASRQFPKTAKPRRRSGRAAAAGCGVRVTMASAQQKPASSPHTS